MDNALILDRIQFAFTVTSIEIMAILQHLNRDKRMIIVMVTHEPDIAAYTNRNIYFRDGRIVRDERLQNPHRADRELLETKLIGEESTV